MRQWPALSVLERLWVVKRKPYLNRHRDEFVACSSRPSLQSFSSTISWSESWMALSLFNCRYLDELTRRTWSKRRCSPRICLANTAADHDKTVQARWVFPFFDVWLPKARSFPLRRNTLIPGTISGNANVSAEEKSEYVHDLWSSDHESKHLVRTVQWFLASWVHNQDLEKSRRRRTYLLGKKHLNKFLLDRKSQESLSIPKSETFRGNSIKTYPNCSHYRTASCSVFTFAPTRLIQALVNLNEDVGRRKLHSQRHTSERRYLHGIKVWACLAFDWWLSSHAPGSHHLSHNYPQLHLVNMNEAQQGEIFGAEQDLRYTPLRRPSFRSGLRLRRRPWGSEFVHWRAWTPNSWAGAHDGSLCWLGRTPTSFARDRGTYICFSPPFLKFHRCNDFRIKSSGPKLTIFTTNSSLRCSTKPTWAGNMPRKHLHQNGMETQGRHQRNR